MGTSHDTYALVGNTSRRLWKLAQLQEDDAAKVLEAKTMNNWEIWRTQWPTHASQKMDQILWIRTPTWMGTLILSYPGCHPKKLVYRDRTPTWYKLMGCLVRGIFVNILISRSMGRYFWQCAASCEIYHFQNTTWTTGNNSTIMVMAVKPCPRMLQRTSGGWWWWPPNFEDHQSRTLTSLCH